MSDKPYWELSRESALRSWVLAQMMRGAGYAAVVVLGAGLFLYALYGISLLLPPESKEAPSPNLGQLEQPLLRALA
jgi:hypothetical protein